MRVGYNFTVEGEYCDNGSPVDDPEDRDWEWFTMSDLHPAGKDEFTVWIPGTVWETPEETPQDIIDTAMTVANWMRMEKRWWYFDAVLYLLRGQDRPPEQVGRFELV